MGANQFTHLRHDEFVARHTGYMRHKMEIEKHLSQQKRPQQSNLPQLNQLQ